MSKKFENSKNMANVLRFRKQFITILEFIILFNLFLTLINFNIISLATLLFSVICMIYLLIDKDRLFKRKKQYK